MIRTSETKSSNFPDASKFSNGRKTQRRAAGLCAGQPGWAQGSQAVRQLEMTCRFSCSISGRETYGARFPLIMGRIAVGSGIQSSVEFMRICEKLSDAQECQILKSKIAFQTS